MPRPPSVSDDDLLLLALWIRYLAPARDANWTDSGLAKKLLDRKEKAVRELLGAITHDRLRIRLRKLRAEIADPYREYFVFIHQWSTEAGLPCPRSPPATMQKRFPTTTPALFESVIHAMTLAWWLRLPRRSLKRKATAFESLRRYLLGVKR
jgi:hypothetical protein